MAPTTKKQIMKTALDKLEDVQQLVNDLDTRFLLFERYGKREKLDISRAAKDVSSIRSMLQEARANAALAAGGTV